MSPRLRPALPTDYAFIANWIKDAQSCARWAGPQLAFPFEVADLSHLLAKPDSQNLVLADHHDLPVGFAQFWKRDDQRVHLGRIIISPATRGLGYGRLMCEQLMQQAIMVTGLTVVSLRVYRDNPAAMHLYRQLGFVATEDDSNVEVLAMEYREAGNALASPSSHSTRLSQRK